MVVRQVHLRLPALWEMEEMSTPIDPKRYADWQAKETFADRMKRIREGLGWSLRKVEEITTVSASTISRIENGCDFHFSVLILLAMAYGVPLTDLLWNLRHIELKSLSRKDE